MGSVITLKMASARASNVVRQVKPLMSLDSNEARARVLSLYKAWYRQIPDMKAEYDIPVKTEECRERLRILFKSKSHIKDVRVIDMLVIQGQLDLQEVVEKWATATTIMSKHFKESIEEKPKDFM